MIDYSIKTELLSEQAKEQILKYIENVNLDESNKLPREEELAQIIGVSRTTIRKALDGLASDGIVFRKQGKGTFVNIDSLNIKVRFNPAMEFTQMISESGYQPSVKLLDIGLIAWNKEIGNMLHLEDGSPLVEAAKLFMADGKFCAYCIDYFSPELIGGETGLMEFAKSESTIFDYIYNLSEKKIEWDKVEISATIGEKIPKLKDYISMKEYGKKAYLCIKGVDYCTENCPLLYTKEYIDTDIIKFNMIRQRAVRYSKK